jgi:hypothetical protein
MDLRSYLKIKNHNYRILIGLLDISQAKILSRILRKAKLLILMNWKFKTIML